MKTRNWILFSDTPKDLDYIENYTTLLEQYRHILEKLLVATVPQRDEDQIHVGLVTWLDFYLVFIGIFF